MTFLLLALDTKPALLVQLVLGAGQIPDFLCLRFLGLRQTVLHCFSHFGFRHRLDQEVGFGSLR